MSTSENPKLSGYLFMTAGCLFFLAAIVGAIIAGQPVFYSFFGVGAAFIAIGVAALRKVDKTNVE